MSYLTSKTTEIGEVLGELRECALENRPLLLLESDVQTLLDFVDVMAVVVDRHPRPFEHLRDIPNVFVGAYQHGDGVVPIDGRLIHFLLDEIDRRDATIAYLDDQATMWRNEAMEWAALVVADGYEGEL